ncbi:hypothetical protein LPB67_18320 [Undibacterium sp. Jales W-56]|uniref:hypothetical protein n=1 Tax=Undibacterium sp. Jales W-56 TaxID=2897325 RepID=UPI0021D1A742|nr:hypothetical protein [Undibacterium sp. Jales W-56]MCU6435736.1 hypothetical protein [Undibacterium sp. Jales W-56]
MNQRHQYLPLSKISAGMVLADDLLDKQGHVLLPAGVILTAGMLTSVENHHIRQLSVFTDNEPDTDMDDLKQHQLERLDILFRHVDDQIPTSILLDYLRSYRSDAI